MTHGVAADSDTKTTRESACIDPCNANDHSTTDDLLRFYQEELGQVTRELIRTRNELEWVRDSVGWRIFEGMQHRLTKLLPLRLRRTRVLQGLRRGLRDWMKLGSRRFLAERFYPSFLTSAPKPDSGTARGWDAGYDSWIRSREQRDIAEAESQQARLKYRPRISLIMPVYNMNPAHLRRAIATVRSQIYSEWELCICDDGSTDRDTRVIVGPLPEQDPRIKVVCSEVNQGIALASNRALSLATGEFVALMDGDDEIAPHALFEIARLLNEHADADFLYTDRDKLDEAGKRFEPFFKPDWSPDLFLSCNYLCHLVVIRRRLVRAVHGFRAICEGSQDYDLFLRILEKTQTIHHVPKPLYHWRVSPTSTAADGRVKMHAHVAARVAIEEALKRRGIDGRVERGHGVGLWRMRYPVPAATRVSIILLSGGDLRLLEQCLLGLREQTAFRNFEIVLVDNSRGTQVADCFRRLQPGNAAIYLDCRDMPFNYSRLNNLAVAKATAPFLLFLNDDVQPCSPDWLEAMLEHGHRPEVGAVGPLLLYPNKTVQHAGIVVGLNGCCDHGMKKLNVHDLGYHHFHRMTRNCSAVTAACLLTRKQVFQEVGGFDEDHLPVAFQDVDLCLKMRALGLLIVYTPFARLFHHEGKTRGACGLHKVAGFEEQWLSLRWGNVIARDPYYSPHLSKKLPGYCLDRSS